MRELPEEVVLPDDFVAPEIPDPPATPRDSATVMLVRDTERGIEVFLLRRALGMAFAGGMTAYPGGGVDPRDADASVAWHGPDPDDSIRECEDETPEPEQAPSVASGSTRKMG